jgi:hypothetical protein
LDRRWLMQSFFSSRHIAHIPTGIVPYFLWSIGGIICPGSYKS